ncbi:MAG: HEPN domain-containing protein [Ignisphaera sp.]|uniref:HEPN domain-containing protein n=1 Tax=Ignisphaera aggregans TaxID=334771 RepID=A0A832ATB8_9CREN
MYSFDESEFNRWIKSARLTLESAKKDHVNRDYNWSCFKAHQAAEKALKALLWGLGSPRIGHSLVELGNVLKSIGIEISIDIYEALVRLSKFYIPTRYPDVWSEGVPEDYYTESESREAIEFAEKVIDWVISVWRKLLKSG